MMKWYFFTKQCIIRAFSILQPLCWMWEKNHFVNKCLDCRTEPDRIIKQLSSGKKKYNVTEYQREPKDKVLNILTAIENVSSSQNGLLPRA